VLLIFKISNSVLFVGIKLTSIKLYFYKSKSFGIEFS